MGDSDKLLEEAAALFPPSLVQQRAHGRALLEGRREGPWLFDESGRRYLDCVASEGIYNLGRRHPELVDELRRAMHETDQGNFAMVSEEKAALAEALAGFCPGELECAVFSVVRGEAVDFACKLARGATGRSELVTVDGGWLGETGFALSLSQRPDRDHFAPLIPEIRVIPADDLEAARAAISGRTAAVVLEPIQAENGCRRIDAAYLRAVQRLCQRNGAALVLDETQSGLGRTGLRFACQHADVIPDVLVLGEALGGGLFPIAATLFTQRLNRFLNEHPLLHLSTFGGSDLGCRVALRALQIYERERPWSNAATAGRALLRGLGELRGSHPELRSVEGQGLLVALDLGDAERARALCRRLADHGVLAAVGRVARHTVLLRPSLLVEEEHLELIVKGVEAALDALEC
jgi:acetylornithine/succinyldiaminopimelate/putrescine aminotransferase